MSAYIVSNMTISAIVDGIALVDEYSYIGKLARKDPKKVGQMLLDENYRSVNERYDEDDKPYEFKFVSGEPGWSEEFMTPHHFTYGQVLGSANCYEYQTCEYEGYDKTETWEAVERMKKNLFERMCHEIGMAVPWGADGEDFRFEQMKRDVAKRLGISE